MQSPSLNACADYETKILPTSRASCQTLADVADNKQAITQEFLDRYYNEHLRFGFGTREKQGLQTFADLCAKHGVLPKRAREFSLV